MKEPWRDLATKLFVKLLTIGRRRDNKKCKPAIELHHLFCYLCTMNRDRYLKFQDEPAINVRKEMIEILTCALDMNGIPMV